MQARTPGSPSVVGGAGVDGVVLTRRTHVSWLGAVSFTK